MVFLLTLHGTAPDASAYIGPGAGLGSSPKFGIAGILILLLVIGLGIFVIGCIAAVSCAIFRRIQSWMRVRQHVDALDGLGSESRHTRTKKAMTETVGVVDVSRARHRTQ